MRGAETITVKRATADPDWQGDSTLATAGELRNCQLWPRTSTEDAEHGQRIIEGWNVYAPPGQDLTVLATDILQIRGKDHNVVGVPGEYDLKGRPKGTIIVASRTGA
jgi:hypothetical protein